MTNYFILKSPDFSVSVLVEWIISVCLNIHTLKIEFPQHPNSFHNKIARLEKLKKLDVMADRANELKEVTFIAFRIMTTLFTSPQLVRSFRQVEILRMEVLWLTVRDLAELEPAENMTDITLRWNRGPPVKEVLLVLKRWRHLSRLSVEVFFVTPFPPFEVLTDFIMAMKHLSYLHIVHDYACLDYDQAEVLRDQIIELIIPLRPNFKFDISCN
jgi:hypothetical protein